MGRNSPPRRIIGKAPTLRWRSEAPWLVAVLSKSSIFTGMVELSPFGTISEDLELRHGLSGVSVLDRMKSADALAERSSELGARGTLAG